MAMSLSQLAALARGNQAPTEGGGTTPTSVTSLSALANLARGGQGGTPSPTVDNEANRVVPQDYLDARPKIDASISSLPSFGNILGGLFDPTVNPGTKALAALEGLSGTSSAGIAPPGLAQLLGVAGIPQNFGPVAKTANQFSQAFRDEPIASGVGLLATLGLSGGGLNKIVNLAKKVPGVGLATDLAKATGKWAKLDKIAGDFKEARLARKYPERPAPTSMTPAEALVNANTPTIGELEAAKIARAKQTNLLEKSQALANAPEAAAIKSQQADAITAQKNAILDTMTHHLNTSAVLQDPSVLQELKMLRKKGMLSQADTFEKKLNMFASQPDMTIRELMDQGRIWGQQGRFEKDTASGLENGFKALYKYARNRVYRNLPPKEAELVRALDQKTHRLLGDVTDIKPLTKLELKNRQFQKNIITIKGTAE